MDVTGMNNSIVFRGYKPIQGMELMKLSMNQTNGWNVQLKGKIF